MQNDTTKAARFTAGPWRVGETREFGRVDVNAMAAMTVARVLPVTDGPASYAEARANAALIASAPALYAALEPIARICDVYRKQASDSVIVWEGVNAEGDVRRLTLGQFRAARSALAQARGEA